MGILARFMLDIGDSLRHKAGDETGPGEESAATAKSAVDVLSGQPWERDYE